MTTIAVIDIVSHDAVVFSGFYYHIKKNNFTSKFHFCHQSLTYIKYTEEFHGE